MQAAFSPFFLIFKQHLPVCHGDTVLHLFLIKFLTFLFIYFFLLLLIQYFRTFNASSKIFYIFFYNDTSLLKNNTCYIVKKRAQQAVTYIASSKKMQYPNCSRFRAIALLILFGAVISILLFQAF
jgi:hypothetical protein